MFEGSRQKTVQQTFNITTSTIRITLGAKVSLIKVLDFCTTKRVNVFFWFQIISDRDIQFLRRFYHFTILVSPKMFEGHLSKKFDLSSTPMIQFRSFVIFVSKHFERKF
jgi:hypothetical protein